MDNRRNIQGNALGKCALFLLLVMASQVIGCAVVATKGDERMVLRGWGATKAVFSDNSSIEKAEPLKVPNLLPTR